MLDWYTQPRYRPFCLTHEDNPGDRPVMLMVHGFTGSPDELRPSARIAHDAGFDVEAMNLPGMGRDIGRFREVGREEWLAAVHERWADVTARYRRRVLFGYSLGAALAILASVSRPADAMVLMSPLVRLADSRAFALPLVRHVIEEIAPFERLDFTKPRVREFFNRTMAGIDLDSAQVREAIRREFVMPTRLLNDCRLVGREAGRSARHIREPVTMFQGRPDAVVGHRNARWLVDHLGGPVTYHEVAGDHLIPFDTMDSWPALQPMLTHTFTTLYERLTW
jgi:carboxylesterase